MKKKIITAIFFATIMMMLPATSALKTNYSKNNSGFDIPLSEEDEKELRDLISRENNDVENELNRILTEDGSLKIEELEDIYEEYIETGDPSVIESDSWDWVLDRLGWIYITLEQVITIYNDAMTLYNELEQGITVVENWWQSIQDLRAAWQSFKQNPLNFQNIKNLLTAAGNVISATINLVDYVSSDDLQEALNTLKADVEDFVTFLENNPWNQPIVIYGVVTNVDESVTISVKSDSETTTSDYELSYTTSDAALSWFVHKCTITVEYKDKKITENKYAFSMGEIEYNIDEEDFKAKSKQKIYLENMDILSKINIFFSRLLRDIFLQFSI